MSDYCIAVLVLWMISVEMRLAVSARRREVEK